MYVQARRQDSAKLGRRTDGIVSKAHTASFAQLGHDAVDQLQQISELQNKYGKITGGKSAKG